MLYRLRNTAFVQSLMHGAERSRGSVMCVDIHHVNRDSFLLAESIINRFGKRQELFSNT